jgi:hypothetical protein
VDSALSFQEEIGLRVKKANRMVGIIRRTFMYLDRKMFILLYKALVRPHLEYAVCIWHSRWTKDIERLEKVQRRATKQVPGLRDLSYPERLQLLQLPSLEYRRLRGDMIETFKIINQIYDINPSDFFTLSTSSTRGHSKKILRPSIKTAHREATFSYRTNTCITISSWNSLPDSVVTSKNTLEFKTRLDAHWSHHPKKFLTESASIPRMQ